MNQMHYWISEEQLRRLAEFTFEWPDDNYKECAQLIEQIRKQRIIPADELGTGGTP